MGEDIQKLLLTSEFLYRTVQDWDMSSPDNNDFHDYSFIVFPAAKAYEGFLKKMFLDLGFITQDDYYGKRFRIGKALNPSLEKEFRKESVYDRIVKYCNGKDLADNLWETWVQCRNLLFHWFPNEKKSINLAEAKQRVEMIVETMDKAYLGCNINI